MLFANVVGGKIPSSACVIDCATIVGLSMTFRVPLTVVEIDRSIKLWIGVVLEVCTLLDGVFLSSGRVSCAFVGVLAREAFVVIEMMRITLWIG